MGLATGPRPVQWPLEARVSACYGVALDRTRSSAVEHYVDIVGVTGSIPVVSTIFFNDLAVNLSNFA